MLAYDGKSKPGKAHETILRFTLNWGQWIILRVILNYKSTQHKIQTESTLAKQLALYVTTFSPLQMAANVPEKYEAHLDAFQFIKDVALDWDKSITLEAEHGTFVTVARKAKNTENWFTGAITNEKARDTKIDLSFLNKNKKYLATIYKNAKHADWGKN